MDGVRSGYAARTADPSTTLRFGRDDKGRVITHLKICESDRELFCAIRLAELSVCNRPSPCHPERIGGWKNRTSAASMRRLWNAREFPLFLYYWAFLFLLLLLLVGTTRTLRKIHLGLLYALEASRQGLGA